MTEDPELASKSISAADIDAIFTKELVNPASNAVEVKIQMKVVSAIFTFPPNNNMRANDLWTTLMLFYCFIS